MVLQLLTQIILNVKGNLLFLLTIINNKFKIRLLEIKEVLSLFYVWCLISAKFTLILQK